MKRELSQMGFEQIRIDITKINATILKLAPRDDFLAV